MSAVVTCERVDLDSSACAAGLLALQMHCAFVRLFWINDCVFITGFVRGGSWLSLNILKSHDIYHISI